MLGPTSIRQVLPALRLRHIHTRILVLIRNSSIGYFLGFCGLRLVHTGCVALRCHASPHRIATQCTQCERTFNL